jgi:hypothetical protein
VQPEYKGFENPLQMSPTPAKTVHNQHSNKWAQSTDGFVPKNNETNGEKWGFWETMGFGILREKMEKWGKMVANGWPVEALWRREDDGVAVGRCLGGGIWILGRLGEERIQRRGKGLYGGGRKWGKRERK